MEHSATEILAAITQETRERELFHEQANALAEKKMLEAAERPLVIGVATITWEYSNTPHPIFLGLLEGIKSRLRASGCDLLLYTTIDLDPDAYLRRCRESGVAGVILHGFTTDDARVSRLLEAGIPCVGVDDIGLAARLGHVSADNVGGALEAVRHLYSVGRRRIATIHAPLSHAVGGERLLGYRIGLEEVGLPARSEYLAEAGFFLNDGVAAMEKLLALDERPDAVFAATDVMAIGAMAAIEKAGLSVPADIAIVGFDDVPYATLVSPSLSSVRQDAPAQGIAAAEGLLRMIVEPSSSPIELVIPVELIVRESSGSERRKSSSDRRELLSDGQAPTSSDRRKPGSDRRKPSSHGGVAAFAGI
ncbi:MAG: substrate-binding domain-containing protein [Gaiellaceae bacterium]|jgi:LacI family transcriptional regulator